MSILYLDKLLCLFDSVSSKTLNSVANSDELKSLKYINKMFRYVLIFISISITYICFGLYFAADIGIKTA